MTDDDREAISCGIAELAEGKVIARRRIGRCLSVISRDIARHGGRTACGRRSLPVPRPGHGAGPRLASSMPTRYCNGWERR